MWTNTIRALTIRVSFLLISKCRPWLYSQENIGCLLWMIVPQRNTVATKHTVSICRSQNRLPEYVCVFISQHTQKVIPPSPPLTWKFHTPSTYTVFLNWRTLVVIYCPPSSVFEAFGPLRSHPPSSPRNLLVRGSNNNELPNWGRFAVRDKVLNTQVGLK